MNEEPVSKEAARLEILELMSTLEVNPLCFEPGISWDYGQGVDWAGQLVSFIPFSYFRLVEGEMKANEKRSSV